MDTPRGRLAFILKDLSILCQIAYNINNLKIYLIFKILYQGGETQMTFIHILNYSIPIGFILFFGFLIDQMCRPAKSAEKTGEE
ncbi:MAG: hypothetical protein K0Q87_2182 [Neobacillus sp.]|jgi:hypothetical protein|nr:hypothetical protein [Neobacillus sp.]